MKPPITELDIDTADSGYYEGFTKIVTITSKVIIGTLIVWAVAFPDQAGAFLSSINSFILAFFNVWYIYAIALFLFTCIALALIPTSGRLKLGLDHEEPEFDRFSWFSMMFGAGIGIGMLTFATAEPLYHWQSNPDTIRGLTEGSSAGNVRAAYEWSFLHWGFGAWGAYALAGLGLAFFSYRRGLPLTIRSSLTPLFGERLAGRTGHIVDIVAVVATVLGVAQTLGFGVEQFIAGLERVGFGGWLTVPDGEGGSTSSTLGIIVALVIIMGASTLSALSGVGKGIKWLSNINMALSFFLLTFFLIFGSTFFGLSAFFVGVVDYVIALPGMMFTIWSADAGGTEGELGSWQAAWSVFYWAWWIAFAPFVGLFLARISKGRTIREYVLGAVIVPSLMCFVWFAMVGGTAIDLELSGVAEGAIVGAGQEDQLFAMLAVMLAPWLAFLFSIIVVILLLTYLVTSADSAVLIINTINAAGDESPKGRKHIIFWGAALALVVGSLLVGGGLGAVQTAMVIGALPFSVVMVLMCFSLFKAIFRDYYREKAGVATLYDPATPAE
ncbi:Glycine betaine transporter OpuD [Rhodobacteraceae bacterium THAF1]|uniref:BCCT family transporter n=1 Tax=Palleronia sp. THAF1 TaxID=2587842 RepID=UPI000F3AC191|nr:BCCT family transporter [Palleronia sp. THAF1]QFU09174.1 Glycine betaine transporter OpuD [Palleronia sp. THAF1]VDC27256.1 Glycine betaine transporter OpuD [Rhodobacteraceae bacterium THAF1]